MHVIQSNPRIFSVEKFSHKHRLQLSSFREHVYKEGQLGAARDQVSVDLSEGGMMRLHQRQRDHRKLGKVQSISHSDVRQLHHPVE
jgi:hypothetical protein